MDITSNNFKLQIECNNCFLVLTLFQTDIIVDRAKKPDWILSVLQLSTPLSLSKMNGLIKNWLNAFGFQECEKLDEALDTFFSSSSNLSLIKRVN